MKPPKRPFYNAIYYNPPPQNWNGYNETARGKQEQKIELFCEKLKDRIFRRSDGKKRSLDPQGGQESQGRPE